VERARGANLAVPPDKPTAVDPLTVQADRAGVSGLIGNTIVDTAKGQVVWIQLERGGAYRTYMNGALASRGLWSYRKGQLCYWPEGPQFRSCAKEHMGGKKVGDAWVATGPNGAVYNARVVQGQLGR
jgi:hypothetical protein